MIKVKLFGTLRLDTHIKEISIEAKTVNDVYLSLFEEIRKNDPNTNITIKNLKGCIVTVNDKPANKYTKLNDNDVVILLSPVCGG